MKKLLFTIYALLCATVLFSQPNIDSVNAYNAGQQAIQMVSDNITQPILPHTPNQQLFAFAITIFGLIGHFIRVGILKNKHKEVVDKKDQQINDLQK